MQADGVCHLDTHQIYHYISVETVEEPGEAIPEPEGEPYPDMDDTHVVVQEEWIKNTSEEM